MKKLFDYTNITSIRLIIVTALFWMVFANASFFAVLLNDYPLSYENMGFVAAVAIGFTGAIILVSCVLCHRYTIKPLLIFLLIASSFTAYFMDSYHVLIDDSMINNMFETDPSEISDLVSVTMFVYVLLLGILPAIFVYRVNIQFQTFGQELIARMKLIALVLVVVMGLFFAYSAKTSSFFREHKIVYYYSNPGNYFIGLGRYVRQQLRSNAHQELIIIGEDASIAATDEHRELLIMVVGETARADRFSLNGYEKPTNPLLEQQDVVSFSDVESCGTLTAVSVPCMFAIDREGDFNTGKSRYKEDVLDVLQRAGVNVLWRDNNSSSKHVADRVEYQDYRTSDSNMICDVECRDEGMLIGLQDYINAQETGDILIVLHQMGNHGPAYYKRYPQGFEKFTPTCQTNELSDCSKEAINNTYDNAIMYTDYFLNKTIELLKKNDDVFETAMLYVGDHGESLGENGIYLHGMPNFIAPENQRHVPLIMWIGRNFDEISLEQLQAKKDKPLTHDNIFHTLLGIMEVDSKVYQIDLDFTRN